MDISEAVKHIQNGLAPAVMISSSALLLLGYQNKFSNLANRFRALNDEKRRLRQKESRDSREETRLANVTKQVDYFMRRATLVKNAILCMYFSILCFTGTSIVIFLTYYIQGNFWWIGNLIFLTGFIFVGISAVSIVRDTRLFYKVMALEHKS